MSSPELISRVKRVRDMIDAGRWDDAIDRVDQRLVETPDEDDHQAYHDLLIDIATRAPSSGAGSRRWCAGSLPSRG